MTTDLTHLANGPRLATFTTGAPWADLGVVGADPVDDDGLSPLRGIVAGAVLSLPVWAGVAVAAWKALH